MTIAIHLVAAGALASQLPPVAGTEEASGKRRVETAVGQTISGLLEELGMDPARPLLIIVAGSVVTIDERPATILNDGDTVSLSPPIRAG